MRQRERYWQNLKQERARKRKFYVYEKASGHHCSTKKKALGEAPPHGTCRTNSIKFLVGLLVVFGGLHHQPKRC